MHHDCPCAAVRLPVWSGLGRLTAISFDEVVYLCLAVGAGCAHDTDTLPASGCSAAADLLPSALQKGEIIQPRYFDEGEIRDIKRRSWMPSFGRKKDNTWHPGDPWF